jgi:hypothetical protein
MTQKGVSMQTLMRSAGRRAMGLSFVALLSLTLAACGGGLKRPTMPATTSNPTTPATTAPAGPSGTASGSASPSNADASAIKAVIQRANGEQVQAVSAGDPSPMKDTATSAYYTQTAQDLQDLLNTGITGIQLVNLQWGQIALQGASTAQATTTETWRTTANDGSTSQDTATNVYTLVREGGVWKIQDDQHPNAQQPSSQQPPSLQPPGRQQPTPQPSQPAQQPGRQRPTGTPGASPAPQQPGRQRPGRQQPTPQPSQQPSSQPPSRQQPTTTPGAASAPVSSSTAGMAAVPVSSSDPTAQAIVDKAQARLGQVNAVHYLLTVDGDLSIGAAKTQKLRSAEGDLVRPDKASATAKVAMGPVNATVRFIQIGNDSYMTNLLTGKWEKVPGGLGYDPSVVFDPQNGVAAILGRISGWQYVESTTVNGVETQHVRGSVPVQTVNALTAGSLPGGTVGVNLYVEGQNNDIVRFVITGQPAAATSSTAASRWTLDLSNQNGNISIVPPI